MPSPLCKFKKVSRMPHPTQNSNRKIWITRCKSKICSIETFVSSSFYLFSWIFLYFSNLSFYLVFFGILGVWVLGSIERREKKKGGEKRAQKKKPPKKKKKKEGAFKRKKKRAKEGANKNTGKTAQKHGFEAKIVGKIKKKEGEKRALKKIALQAKKEKRGRTKKKKTAGTKEGGFGRPPFYWT